MDVPVSHTERIRSHAARDHELRQGVAWLRSVYVLCLENAEASTDRVGFLLKKQALLFLPFLMQGAAEDNSAPVGGPGMGKQSQKDSFRDRLFLAVKRVTSQAPFPSRSSELCDPVTKQVLGDQRQWRQYCELLDLLLAALVGFRKSLPLGLLRCRGYGLGCCCSLILLSILDNGC